MSVKPNPKSGEDDCDEQLAKKRKTVNDNQMDKATLDRVNNLKDLFTKAQEGLNSKKIRLMIDNGNNNIQKIKTIFQTLRMTIDQHEERLKNEVLAAEEKNEAPIEDCRKSIRSKQDSLSSENEIFNKLVATGQNDQLEKDEARFQTFLQQFTNEVSALVSPNIAEYCIDEIDTLKDAIDKILTRTCVSEFAQHRQVNCGRSDCKGRRCIKCGKCRDWYYKGDFATWKWITNIKEWNEEEREQWDNGNYKNFFIRRDGSTCIGRYNYYYDRNNQYHGPHIYFSSYKICKGCNESLIFLGDNCCEVGVRTSIESYEYEFCQCPDNVKITA